MQLLEQKKERSKYAQGRLHIVTFSQLGEKLNSYISDHDNYVDTIKQGHALVAEDGEVFSFAVIRVLYNSLKPGRWG